MNRHVEVKREVEPPAELESQFIMRLPPEPANVLREAIRSGAVHLKDRLSIKLENDMRYGEVRVDHWLMHAKVVDLPTVMESLKTIDNKSFYKTADISQLLLCKEEDDQTTTDEESPAKSKKKDPNKVDKKFLWPHGITPPMKNVRRRRFRKTLKKKYVEAPEIEKEVKRLLRVDNDAVNVKWEVINEDEEKLRSGIVKEEREENDVSGVTETLETSTQQSVDVAEHDIFGGAVSDSEEEEATINIMELEEESRPSADDSHLSDSTSLQVSQAHSSYALGLPSDLSISQQESLITEFSKEMFASRSGGMYNERKGNIMVKQEQHHQSYMEGSHEYPHHVKMEQLPVPIEFDVIKSENGSGEEMDFSSTQPSRDSIRARLDILEQELAELSKRRHQQEFEIVNIENQALRQRFQDILDNLLTEQLQKEQEYQELTSMLHMQ